MLKLFVTLRTRLKVDTGGSSVPLRFMTRRIYDKWAHVALFTTDIPSYDMLTSSAYSGEGMHLHAKAVAFPSILCG